MPGRGRVPKEERMNPRDIPQRGDWKSPESSGWQHGDIPKPPSGLLKASREAWDTWMNAWFAAFWTPEDLPGLFTVVMLFDQVQRGKFQRSGELRIQMDSYGITPKGQQDRRWKKPTSPAPATAPKQSDHYGHLRAVSSD